MTGDDIADFKSLKDNPEGFKGHKKTLLIPEMNRIGCRLLAASFRAFDVDARVIPTGKGLDLGKEYTSGKECYPCMITLGDILSFLYDEKERLGNNFDAGNYTYFMPDASGPCRFGMYNRYQRMVLDSIPSFTDIGITSLSSDDGYSLAGVISKKEIRQVRKIGFLSVVTGDILDRLLWKIRPYEKSPGMADEFIDRAICSMERAFEGYGSDRNIDNVLRRLDMIIEEAKTIKDPAIPPKPKIGIIGEIYLRSHTIANQDLIKTLEAYGAEVVNASITEWVNYTAYDALRKAKTDLSLNIKQHRYDNTLSCLKDIVRFGLVFFYQERVQKHVYRHVRELVDIEEDHAIGHMENILREEDLFSFDIGTEACLSIPAAIEYVRHGFDGVVNVYPLTCMPSTITSAVIRPVMHRAKIPYLDTPYDATAQPGRESDIRTFMYQAYQHKGNKHN